MAKKKGSVMNIPGQLLYIGKEATKDYFREYTDNLSGLVDDGKEILDTITQGKSKVVDVFNDIKQNGGKKALDWFMQRSEETMEDDLNDDGNDSDFDAGFQVGDDGDDEESHTRIDDDDMAKKLARGQVNAMYQIGAKQAETSMVNAAEIVSHIDGRASEIIASLSQVNKSIIGIGEKIDAIGQLMQTKAEIEERERKERNSGMFDSSGRVTLGSFAKTLSTTMKDTLQNNMLVDMLKNKDMWTPAGVLSMILSGTKEKELGKLGGFLGKGLDKLNIGNGNMEEMLKTQTIDSIGNEFNKTIGNAISDLFTGGMTKSVDVLADKMGNGMLASFMKGIVGDVTGAKRDRIGEDHRSEIQTSYTKETAKFDGIVRQTIVEIIPDYLRAITKAVSGKDYHITTTGHLSDKEEDYSKMLDASLFQGNMMNSASNKRRREFMKQNRSELTKGVSGTPDQNDQKQQQMVAQLDKYDAELMNEFTNAVLWYCEDHRIAFMNKTHLDDDQFWSKIQTDMISRLKYTKGNGVPSYLVKYWLRQLRTSLTSKGGVFGYSNDASDFLSTVNRRLRQITEADREVFDNLNAAGQGHKFVPRTRDNTQKNITDQRAYYREQDKLDREKQQMLEELYEKDEYKEAQKQIKKIGNKVVFDPAAKMEKEAIEKWEEDNKKRIEANEKLMESFQEKTDREEIQVSSINEQLATIVGGGISVGSISGSKEFSKTLFEKMDALVTNTSETKAGIDLLLDAISNLNINNIQANGDVPPLVYKNIYGGDGDSADDKDQMNDIDKEQARSINEVLTTSAQNGELSGQEVAFVRRLTSGMKNREMANKINQRATMWATTLKQTSMGKAVSEGLEKAKGKSGLGGFVGKAFAVVASVGKMIIGKVAGFLGKFLVKPLMGLAKKGFMSGWKDIKKGFATIFNKPYDEKAAHSEEMAEATKQTSLLETLINNLNTHWNEEKQEKAKKEGKELGEGGEEEPKKQGFFGKVKQKASAVKDFAVDTKDKVVGGASTLLEATKNTMQNFSERRQNRENSSTDGDSSSQESLAPDNGGEKPTLGGLAKQGLGKAGGGILKAVGSIGKTLGNFAKGSLSILKGVGKIILTAVASLSAVKVLMDLVQKTLVKSLKPLNKGLKTLISHLQPLIAKMGKVVSAIAGSITTIIAQLSPFIDKVVDIASDILSSLLPVLDPVLGCLTLIAGAIEPILDLIQPTLPKIAGGVTMLVGIVQAGIAAIEGVLGGILKGVGWLVKKFNKDDSLEQKGDELLKKSGQGFAEAGRTLSDGWDMMTGKSDPNKKESTNTSSASSSNVQITAPIPSTGGAVDAYSGSGDEDHVSDNSTLVQQLSPYLEALTNEVHGIRGIHEEYTQPAMEAQTVYEDSMLKMQDNYIKREQMMSSKVLIPMYSTLKNDVAYQLESIESLQKVQIGNDAAYYGQALGAAGLQLVAAGQQAAGAALFQTSIGLSAAGMVYQSEGATSKANATSYLLTGKPFYMSSLYNEPESSTETTQNTDTPSEIINDKETPETTTEEKTTIEVPEVSNTRRIREYLATEGSGDSQGSYGSYLNMSKRGCGPVALADAANRRGGSVNAGALASSMASSGNYSSSRGTSVGGFLSTAASMGMGYTPGGVTSQSLGRATPNNPITLVGSGAGFGTRSGNTHYINVVGTDRAGGAYVSNPLSGRVERRSANELAASSVLGLYGSGDIGSIPSGLYGLYAGDGYDIYGNDITKFGGDTNNHSPGGWDYFEKLGEKIYDWKESNDQYNQLTKSTWSKNNAVKWYEKEASSAQQGWIKTMYANENPHSIGFSYSSDKCQTWLVNKLNSLAQSNSSLGWINRKTSSFNSLLSAAVINSGKKNNNSSSSSTQTSSSIQTSSTPTKKNLNLNRDKTTTSSGTITQTEAKTWLTKIRASNAGSAGISNGLNTAYEKYNKYFSAVHKNGQNAGTLEYWWWKCSCIYWDTYYQEYCASLSTQSQRLTFAKWYASLTDAKKLAYWSKIAYGLIGGNDPLMTDVETEAASNESDAVTSDYSGGVSSGTAAAQGINLSAPAGGRTGYISTEQKYAHDSAAGSEVPQVEGDSFAERMKSALSGLTGIFSNILKLFSTDSETEVEDAVQEDKNKKMERVIREAIGNEEYEEYMNQAFDLYKKEHPKHDTETEEKYQIRMANAWKNEDTQRKYFLAVTKNNANVINAMKANDLYDASEGSMSTMYGEYDAETGEWSGGLLNAAINGNAGTIVDTSYNDPYAGKFVSDGGAVMWTDAYQPTIFDTAITENGGTELSKSPVHEFFWQTSGLENGEKSDYAFSNDGNWFVKRQTPDNVGQGSTGEEHKGIDIKTYPKDIMTAGKSELHAITGGTVTDVRFAGEGNTNSPYNQTDDGGWGNSVQFKDAGGYFHRYAHMRDKPTINVGDTITGGQLLGVIGNTGDSSGEHVHYQLQSGDGTEEGSTFVNPLTYFKYHQPTGTATGAVQGEIPYEGILQSRDVWENHEKAHHADWPAFIQKGANAGMTPAEIATVASMGIWEDGAQKFFGEKSLTATTHDGSGQRAEGIMNWVEKGVAGNTLEDQLKYVKNRYWRMTPMSGKESSGTYRESSKRDGGEDVFRKMTGRANGFRLNVGDRYADMLNTDLIEGSTYYYQGDLAPAKAYTETGLGDYVGTAVGMYNWMLRNGYTVAPASTYEANNATATDPAQIGTGTGGPTAYSTYSDQDTNMGIIWNYLRNNLGYSEEASAGVMGNISAESGYFPMAVYQQGGKDHSYPDDFNKALVEKVDETHQWSLGENDPFGIVQWLGGRRNTMIEKAASENKSIADLPMQLDYVKSELESSESKTHAQMKTLNDVASAADYWRLNYERCGEQAADKRRTRAQEAYDKFKGTNGIDAGSLTGGTTIADANTVGVTNGGKTGYWVGKFNTAANWASKTYGYGGSARNSGQGKGFSSFAFSSVGGRSNYVDVSQFGGSIAGAGGGNLNQSTWVNSINTINKAADEAGLHTYIMGGNTSIDNGSGKTIYGRPDCTGLIQFALSNLDYDIDNIQSHALTSASSESEHPIKKDGVNSDDFTAYKWSELGAEGVQPGDILVHDGHGEIGYGMIDGKLKGWNWGYTDGIINTQKVSERILNGEDIATAMKDGETLGTNHTYIVRPTGAALTGATTGVNTPGSFSDSPLATPMFMTPLDKDVNGNPTEDIFYGERGRPITKMTWHTWADDGALSDCVGWWKDGQGKQTDGQQKEEAAGGKHKTGVSANYIIDTAGNIGQTAHESIATHTSSDEDNDRSAVTIEIANEKGASGESWRISDASLNAAKKLTVDVAKRNGITGFNYTAKNNGYKGDGKDGTWTYHRMFSLNGKSCPGDYIVNQTDSILADINKQISGSGDEISIPPIDQSKIMTSIQPSTLSDYVEDTSQIPPANKTNIIVTKSSEKEIEMMERMMNHTYNVRAEQVEILLQTIIDKMDNLTKDKPTSTQTPSQPQNQFPNNDIPKQIQQLARG